MPGFCINDGEFYEAGDFCINCGVPLVPPKQMNPNRDKNPLKIYGNYQNPQDCPNCGELIKIPSEEHFHCINCGHPLEKLVGTKE